MTQSGSELDNVLFVAPASSSWYPLLTRVYLSWGRIVDSGQGMRRNIGMINIILMGGWRVYTVYTVYRARIVVTNNSKTDVLTALLWRRAASRHCSLHKAARPDSCWVFTRYLHSAANKRWMLNNHLQLQPSTVVILVMGGESFTATGHNTAQPS